MRAYLTFIFVFGILGALAGRMNPSSSQMPAAAQRAFDGGRSRIAELEAQNEAHFSNVDGTLELQRGSDGQFYADVRVNGTYLHMLVDTGASIIALSRDDARSAGLITATGANDVIGEGADGAVHGEYARLDNVELGPLTAQGLDAVILDSGSQSLLGQSFLSKFDSVQIEGDRMILRENS